MAVSPDAARRTPRTRSRSTVKVAVHTSALATLYGSSRRARAAPELPATNGIVARRKPVKRPRNRALPPWRAKKPSTRASRSRRARRGRRDARGTAGRAGGRASRLTMSPATAAAHTSAISSEQRRRRRARRRPRRAISASSPWIMKPSERGRLEEDQRRSRRGRSSRPGSVSPPTARRPGPGRRPRRTRSQPPARPRRSPRRSRRCDVQGPSVAPDADITAPPIGRYVVAAGQMP